MNTTLRTRKASARRYSPARAPRPMASRQLRARKARKSFVEQATPRVEFVKLSIETISALIALVVTILGLFGIVVGS